MTEAWLCFLLIYLAKVYKKMSFSKLCDFYFFSISLVFVL